MLLHTICFKDTIISDHIIKSILNSNIKQYFHSNNYFKLNQLNEEGKSTNWLIYTYEFMPVHLHRTESNGKFQFSSNNYSLKHYIVITFSIFIDLTYMEIVDTCIRMNPKAMSLDRSG